ncbi:hypothetical protein GJ744_000063 [Endocarpon pusillum]|uniref:Proteophosphoglycan 5 n=1 Tax=Endocarpon pusillum TaxID=364733 RepID=A0A8H7ASA9_9EURO|nr:hypothetical protein GJ744_000063 [Endocarpon pusillum]
MMSAPLANSLQGPRRSPRRSKKDSNSMAAQSNVSSSEPSPPALAAKTAFSKPPSTNEPKPKSQATASKKKSQGSKKQNDGPESNRPKPYAQTSSQSNLLSPDRKATPLKQAYAGPTFHSSPAASSLPMPSFYSKSLPTVSASPRSTTTNQLDGEGPADSDAETLMPINSEGSTLRGREPSPLDFMFEAARKARNSPKTQSPDFRVGRLSPFDDIPKTTPQTPGDPSSESVFPFELDGNGGRSLSVDPSFATPYRDRIEALRSPKVQSVTPIQGMGEKERREKSEALKRFLTNGSPQSSPHKPDMNSYFSDRASDAQSASPTLSRHRSGPPTPQYGIQHGPVPRHYFQNVLVATPERGTPIPRPVSSHLRREYQPDDYQAPAELDSDSGASSCFPAALQNNRRSVSGQNIGNFGSRPQYSMPNQKIQMPSSHSAQKLEDDLRRVLKLDLTSST